MATAVSLLARVTTAPLVGAAALKVTVPVELFPAVTLAGLRLNSERVVAGITLTTTEKLAAWIVAEVALVTKLVETVKLADVDPAGTVTLAGTVATAALLLESGTSAPPAGAAALSVTVPIEAAPPGTLLGLRLNAERAEARVTVSVAELKAPP